MNATSHCGCILRAAIISVARGTPFSCSELLVYVENNTSYLESIIQSLYSVLYTIFITIYISVFSCLQPVLFD